LNALLLVVEGLSDRRIRLVAAGWADTLVLVIDPGRRIECRFQASRPEQGGRAPLTQDITDRTRDLDLPFEAHFLLDDGTREDDGQIIGGDGLAGTGVQNRRQGLGQIGVDVVPVLGNVPLIEQVLYGISHGNRGVSSFVAHQA